MTFLPIVERELRVQARRAGMKWTRWGFAALAILLVTQSLTMYRSDPTAQGKIAYQVLLGIGCVLACAGAWLTADALSRERRDGTLGFLFLTDLKGYDVILGKLAASGLLGFYALLGLAPALALPLLAGGVTLGEVMRATLSLVNLLFVTLGVGLWVSTRAESQYGALRRTGMCVLGLLLLPKLAGSLWPEIPITRCSPLESLLASNEAEYLRSPSHFWWSLGIGNLVGWLFLLFAAWRASRGWRERDNVPEARDAKTSSARRQTLPLDEPISWRASQLRGQGAVLWTGALLKALYGLPFFLFFRWNWGGPSPYYWAFAQGLFMALDFCAAALFAWAGARFFLEGRRSGELELLASTPVGARELVSGQWTALWRRLRWVMLFLVLVVGLPNALMTLSGQYGRGPLPSVVPALRSLLTLANVVVSTMTLCWLGMWFGLRMRRAVLAVSAAVAIVKGLPWVVSGLANALMAWRWGFGGGGLPLYWTAFYLGLPLLFFVVNWFLISWARRSLERQLKAGAGFWLDWKWSDSRASVHGWLRRVRHWTPT